MLLRLLIPTASLSVACFAYQIFGDNILADIALPELEVGVTSNQPDHSWSGESNPILVQENPGLTWPESAFGRNDTSFLRMNKDTFFQNIDGLATFKVSGGQTIEWKRYDDSISDRDMRTLLLDGAIAALFIQRGALVFRGTCIQKSDQAVLLLGSPSSGKSTLAYALLMNGWSLVSSEISTVDASNRVHGGIYSIKLWLDVVRALGLDANTLPVVRRGLNRFALMPPHIPASCGAYPLRAVYIIGRNKKRASAPAENKSVEDDQDSGAEGPINQDDDFLAIPFMSQHVALMSYRNSICFPRFYRGMEAEAQMFTNIAQLSGHNFLYRLQVPSDIKTMMASVSDLDLLDPASIHSSRSDLARSNPNVQASHLDGLK